jgi:dTDP-4-dehydrorhamnose reductase
MKILLFGGSGTMGTAIDRVCQSVGIECIQPSHAEVDVTDGEALVEAIGRFSPDVVVNSVAMIGYDLCENEPDQAFRINSLPASAMAKICADRDLTFVQLSTHAVFDGCKDAPYTESDTPDPLNCYAATKYLAELFCRNLCPRHYVVRLPTLFGSRRNDRPGFVDKILSRAAMGEALRVAADKLDSPTYSLDAALGLVGILRDFRPYGVYHLANQGSVSYYDFVVTMMQTIGSPVKIMPVKDSDFPFQGLKPLRTAMASELLPAMRSWQDALQAYLEIEGER